MSRNNYIKLHSMIKHRYMYIDHDAYRADRIFHDHNVKVKFMKDFCHDTYSGYVICIVKVKRKDEQEFLHCMNELRNRCLLFDKDYNETVDRMLNSLKL